MKIIYITGIIIVAVTILVSAVYLSPINQDKGQSNVTEMGKSSEDSKQINTPEIIDLKTGRYVDYDSQISHDGYNKTILFFHAPWCPECRSYEKAITRSQIPDGVQIIKVDYDTSSELKTKYGVTLQTTFVSIDSLGEKQKLWVGYEKEKSVDIILENT